MPHYTNIINKVLDKNLLKLLLTALIIGINSGLVYAFLVTTTTAYFKDNGISLLIIGLLSIKTVPHSFKYLWSPFVNSHHIHIFPRSFGLRKSWIISMQFILFILIGTFGYINIANNILLLIFLILIGFFSATYDIAMEAYRIEIFSREESGLGNACVVYGFRIGLAISGIFGLFLSAMMEWKYVFSILSLFILPCIVIVYFSNDKSIYNEKESKLSYKAWFRYKFIEPMQILLSMPKFAIIITTISFYKVSDAYLDTMTIPFLMDIGFSKNEIAGVAKSCGMIGVIIGTFIGGILITKIHFKFNLILAEVLASITNLQFLFFLNMKNNVTALGIINLVENISYGMSNIILITYMSSLCSKKHIATHYATLISFSGLIKSFLSPTSGIVVENFGWKIFFIVSSLLSIPSLFCIYLLYWHNRKLSVK